MPHQVRRSRPGLHAPLREDRLRVEVQEAIYVPQAQVRAAVREACLRGEATLPMPVQQPSERAIRNESRLAPQPPQFDD